MAKSVILLLQGIALAQSRVALGIVVSNSARSP
jgi:hypothetical protein